jgi:phosphatidylserine decarboxylase
MLVATIVLGGAAVALAVWYWPLAAVPILVWAWVISFFRDPHRAPPAEPGVLVAPADGKVTEITDVDHDDQIGGPARRIGIFLSIFNVHINRSPCAGQVRSITYQKGEFLNALNPDSSRRNESNTVVFDGGDGAPTTVVVRQIAGVIARRIVCHAKAGDQLVPGERFGMIKFGSRTELTIPVQQGDRVVVAAGQTVYAGSTVLIRLGANERDGEA